MARFTLKKSVPAWAALFAICAVCAILLACTFNVTKSPIAKQESAAAESARKSVMSAAERFEEVEIPAESAVKSLYKGVTDGETVGYVAVVAAKGYGGEVEVTVGIGSDGRTTGISVGGANFSETAGLGAKSKEPAFTDQFANRETPLRVVKTGGTRADDTVDAITSATVTSTAVTNAVNAAGEYVKALLTGE